MLSEEILDKRAGNFTASENHNLMAGWDTPKPEIDYANDVIEDMYDLMKDLDTKPLIKDFTCFGAKITGKMINEVWGFIKWERPSVGLVTYAKEKAMEELFTSDPSLNFSTAHTRNGEEREVECMELLSKATGLDFINTGDDQIHLSDNDIGCTPDGIVLDELDLILTGAEVKCKSPLVHAKNLLINNNKDMLKNAFDHYTQIQTQMLVTGTDHWYFANYNPFAKSESLKFKYIYIYRDQSFIEALKKRVEIAKTIKNEFLQELKKLDKAA